jgi:prepilin peptidase CpaA
VNIIDSIQLAKVLLLMFVVVYCTVTDLSMRRIPNMILAPALMAALFFSAVDGGLAGLADSVGGLVVGILMLMPLHLLGRMGAGDIKLLGVIGSILGTWGAIVAGLATLIAGGLLGIAYILWLYTKPQVVLCMSELARLIAGTPPGPSVTATSSESIRATEIPYALAIAAGTFAALFYLNLLPEVSIT